MPREAALARTMVELADTLVDDFDVVELLTLLTDRCLEIFGASAAGIMLVSAEGDLGVVASSSEAMRVLELFELQCHEGPCLDCFHSANPIVNQNVRSARSRWPRFSIECLRAGFTLVHAVPLRLRGTTIGVLNLFQLDQRVLTEGDVAAAQALADVATIAILQYRSAQVAQAVIEDLRLALESRVVIEQAKGVLAERAGIEVEGAFAVMRRYARDRSLRLSEVAQDVIEGTLDPSDLPSR